MDQSSSSTTTRGILTLYPDLIECIAGILPDADRHNLGRTCQYFSLLIPHQTCAVLSPNIHNIAAFRALANDSIRRKEVTTIVYDDARLYRPSIDDHYHGGPAVLPEDTHDLNIGNETGVPSWYRKGYRTSLRFIKTYGHSQQQRFEVAQRFLNPLSPRESYDIYQNLGAQQDHVIATGLDIVTLRQGLDKFPNLRRVILTPAAHGTPPIPRGWPIADIHTDQPVFHAWDNSSRTKWRGFCVVTQEIADWREKNENACIPEFIIDCKQLRTGINCRVFDTDIMGYNQDYRNLRTIVQQPGFKRLELVLYATEQNEAQWVSFLGRAGTDAGKGEGNLFELLSAAKDLEHFSLSTNLNPTSLQHLGNLGESGTSDEHFAPLFKFLPYTEWSNLRHFGLSRFLVNVIDLTVTLSILPKTVRSIELSFLMFTTSTRGSDQMLLSTGYSDVLQFMKERQDLLHLEERCKITIRVDAQQPPEEIDVSREACSYVYEGGPNPFAYSTVLEGIGVLKNALDPDYARPNVSHAWNTWRNLRTGLGTIKRWVLSLLPFSLPTLG
ncbi:hypothetical protein BKA59DRAFT_522836 [Fusarium tricinctum]|uniref:F-box domain-containing protein n=1 Tax=Fusarium tricinctum TaxID=61284 RepID=A0A8K0WFR7_9HYPO|nr:hypothetical protein BKA59DRAFT_522836 [Fusarium tricinctum]